MEEQKKKKKGTKISYESETNINDDTELQTVTGTLNFRSAQVQQKKWNQSILNPKSISHSSSLPSSLHKSSSHDNVDTNTTSENSNPNLKNKPGGINIQELEDERYRSRGRDESKKRRLKIKTKPLPEWNSSTDVSPPTDPEPIDLVTLKEPKVKLEERWRRRSIPNLKIKKILPRLPTDGQQVNATDCKQDSGNQEPKYIKANNVSSIFLEIS